jgi:hypothetical protein
MTWLSPATATPTSTRAGAPTAASLACDTRPAKEAQQHQPGGANTVALATFREDIVTRFHQASVIRGTEHDELMPAELATTAEPSTLLTFSGSVFGRRQHPSPTAVTRAGVRPRLAPSRSQPSEPSIAVEPDSAQHSGPCSGGRARCVK